MFYLTAVPQRCTTKIMGKSLTAVMRYFFLLKCGVMVAWLMSLFMEIKGDGPTAWVSLMLLNRGEA